VQREVAPDSLGGIALDHALGIAPDHKLCILATLCQWQLDFGAANAAHSDNVRNVAGAKIGSPH